MDVATHKPDDIGLVLITVGEEGAVFPGSLHTQLTVLYQSAPDTHHTDIDAVLLSQVDDVVEMIPVAVTSGRFRWQRVRRLTVDVIGRHPVDYLYLYHVVALLTTTLQIPFGLCTVQTFG